jgi:hypothetical protein
MVLGCRTLNQRVFGSNPGEGTAWCLCEDALENPQLGVAIISRIACGIPNLNKKEKKDAYCYVYCVLWRGRAQGSKARYEIEPKITCPKIFIFQPILEFQKPFHYTKANTVKLSTFQ